MAATRMRYRHLEAALRTTLACAVVACTTLYAPASLGHILTYPSFSYMTTILIVSEATLGDTIRGCWHAVYASVQVMITSIFTLWVVGPGRMTPLLAAVAVAISAFVVALPVSTPLLVKRISFGQIVIVYVGAVIDGPRTGLVMHPVHVSSSTALGALASVLAMLLPYPRLARTQVKKACKSYVEDASRTLDLFVEAFTVQNNQDAAKFLFQAELLSETGRRHLQDIKDAQGGMAWEKPWVRRIASAENFQEIHTLISGMETALASCRSFPVGILDEELRHVLTALKGKLGAKLEQAKCIAPSDATTAPETINREHFLGNSLWTTKTCTASPEDVPAIFFLCCLELLQSDDLLVGHNNNNNNNNNNYTFFAGEMKDTQGQVNSRPRRTWNIGLILKPNVEGLNFAVKCSLSLGFAVLFGLIYNKATSCWSGLTIAISFLTERQATFTVVNARAQGTTMGSVYGILCCFLFNKFDRMKFLTLLPWIVFTSFLRHSKMYGQAGGISAAIGALLILGRENYGPASEFAIARITEASIGLICFTVVECLLQPARAASLTKAELAISLRAFRDCVRGIVLLPDGKKNVASLREKQKQLESHVDKLEKFVTEAKLEPNFWFSPFHGGCYDKFLKSLRTMNDLVQFTAFEIKILQEVSERLGIEKMELENKDEILELFQEKVSHSLKCLEEVLLIKSLADMEKNLQKKNTYPDIESGNSPGADPFGSLGPNDKEISKIVSSFLQESKEVANKVNASEGEEKLKSQMIVCLSGLVFCIDRMMRGTNEIEKELKELIALENATSNINLYEISCKINALNTKEIFG